MANSDRKVIAIISHALVQEPTRKRWRLLAKKFNYDVHLIVPREWHSTWLHEKVIYTPEEIHEESFHIHPIATTSKSVWGRYFFLSFDARLRSIKPDLIYIVHEEAVWVHHQIYLYRKLCAPNAKIIFFSMNARGVPQQRFYHRWMWRNIKRNTDAALVHYPGCLQSLREGGYDKPVYLQTQIGVDETSFQPNSEKRNLVRKQLGFENKFVIGYTGRLIEDKGVDDLVEALPLDGIDWALLLVGNGNLREQIEKKAEHEGWRERLHITGFVPMEEVPHYMNAMDCFVLGSKTMPHWVDTFPLVTVQAQACGVPVIASDSGSLPWQLADTALIYPEGHRGELKKRLLMFADNAEMRDRYADIGQNRALKYFCAEGMTYNFDNIVRQVMDESFEFHAKTESYQQEKAY